MAKRTRGEWLDCDWKGFFVALGKASAQATLTADPDGAYVHALDAVGALKGRAATAEEATRQWVLKALTRSIYRLVGGNYGNLSRREAELQEICSELDLQFLERPLDLGGDLKDVRNWALVRDLQEPLAEWLVGMDGDTQKARQTTSKLGRYFVEDLDSLWKELSEEDRARIKDYVVSPLVAIRAGQQGPKLTLIPPRRRANRDPITSDFDLLLAHHRSTPLIGRDAELAELQGWLASDKDIAVRVVSGAAGAGKTRLAIELIEAAGEEWDAGFVDDRELKRFQSKENLADWSWTRPTLIVVDYAAAMLTPLSDWLEELALQDTDEKPPLRLLLLERQAAEGEGWLRLLMGAQTSGDGVEHLFEPPEPLRLEALSDASQRRAILLAAMTEAARFHGKPAPVLPAPGEDAWFDQRLDGESWADPLVLMMAALVAVESGVGTALSLSRRDLAFRLAERRLHRIRRFASDAVTSPVADLLAHLAAYVTLCQGLSKAQALAAAEEECKALGKHHPSGHGALVDELETAMPGPEGLAPIKPDILGEAAVLLALDDCADAKAAVLRAAQRAGAEVVATVIRAAQNYSFDDPREKERSVRIESLEWLEALVERGEADEPGLLSAIDAAMPHNTVVLRKPAARVTRAALDRLVKMAGSGSDQDLAPEIARLNNNLANRLSDLGRREEALERAEEAVRIRRELAAARPDAFLPYLATSLNNLANRLSDLGRREEALERGEEAVRIRRELAAARPDAFLPDLAMSLNSLAAMLSDLGRREEALERGEEAVRIYRELATARPDAFLPDLAMSLNNAAVRLSDLGRREEALERAEEAVRIRRELAAARPDAFLPDLAMSLNNLANRLSDLGRREEALERAEEAVRIYGELAAARPDAFGQNLAISFTTKGRAHVAMEAHGEAVASFAEGLRVIVPLFRRLPAAFGQTTVMLVQDYMQAAEKAGLEPEEELLRPIVEVLQTLQADSGDGEGSPES